MLSGKAVREILDRITVGPSMLFASGFGWDITPISPGATGPGFFVQFWYSRPDTNTGKLEPGYSRKEFISSTSHGDAVIKTGFVLMKSIVEHELLEAFLVDGVRVFDPHQTVEQLKAGKSVTWVGGSEGNGL